MADVAAVGSSAESAVAAVEAAAVELKASVGPGC